MSAPRLIEVTLQAHTPIDRERLEAGLNQLVRDDPTLTAEIDPIFEARATYRLRFTRYEPVDARSDEDDRSSHVGAPLKPSPGLRDTSIASPEPDDEYPSV